jgi:hypothetical protein
VILSAAEWGMVSALLLEHEYVISFVGELGVTSVAE